MRADARAFILVIVIGAGVAIGWTLGNVVTRRLGLS